MQHHTAYLSLGANIGDRQKTFQQACAHIEELVGTIRARSPIYTSAPLNPSELQAISQPYFLNAAIAVETRLSAPLLLETVLTIEHSLGRNREVGIHWGPRVIDIDILYFDDAIVSTENLQIPHSHIPNRDFVLEPLSVIAPSFIHPIIKKTAGEMLEALKSSGKELFITGIHAESIPYNE